MGKSTPQRSRWFFQLQTNDQKIVDSYSLNGCELLLSEDDTVRIPSQSQNFSISNFRVTSFRIHFIFSICFGQWESVSLVTSIQLRQSIRFTGFNLDFLVTICIDKRNPTRWFGNRSPLVSRRSLVAGSVSSIVGFSQSIKYFPWLLLKNPYLPASLIRWFKPLFQQVNQCYFGWFRSLSLC